MTDRGELSNYAISIDNISFTLGSRAIYKEFSLDVERGRFVAIVGPSGCGKSTLFDLICGFKKTQSGEICILGVKLDNESLSEIRPKISLIPQGTSIIRDSLKNNVFLFSDDGACSDDKYYDFIVDLLNLGVFHNKIIDPSSISGGQLQRVLLARALIGRPKILLLDESMNALDEKGERSILSSLRKIDKMTVLSITHRSSLLDDYDDIIYVCSG